MEQNLLKTVGMLLMMMVVGSAWGQVIIARNCDPNNNYAPDRFAEIYNSGETTVDLTGWTLENIQNGEKKFSWILSGSIASGQTLICGNSDVTSQTISPDFTAEWIGMSWNGTDGDGTILKNNGVEVDIAVQNNTTGGFPNKQMKRKLTVSNPTTTYDPNEWILTTVNDALDVVPGFHGTVWRGTGTVWTTESNWDNLVPTSSVNVTIPGSVTKYPNVDNSASSPAITNNLTIATGATLTINVDKAITINGILTNNAGTSGLIIESNISGTGSLIGGGSVNATVQRYLTNYTSQFDNKYHFISSPVTAQAIQPEFVANSPAADVDFYKYDEVTNFWINTKDDNGDWNGSFGANFEIGKGYLVAYPTALVTKSFTGSLNSYTSDAPLEITCTNTNDNGWNLIGNPFPSAIDWDAVVSSGLSAGMDNALYYYDADAANYRYYIQLTGETQALGSGSRYIPSSQGFMVHAKSTGIKKVTLHQDHQTHSTQSFYKGSRNLSDHLVLKVTKDGKEDETTLFFYPEATNGFDGLYDAYKLYSYSEEMPQLYSIIESNTKLAINTMCDISENQVVLLGFKTQTSGEFLFSASGLESFINCEQIILEDKYMDKLHDLKSEGDYTFISETGDFADRFEIHFGVVGVDESPEFNQINAYVYNNSLYVQSQLDNAQVALYDIQGRQMFTKRLNTNGLHKTELNLPTGIYIVRLQSNNQVKNTKVLFK